jgi:branched-chain amino acid transport system ATP-binding protein
VAVLEARGLTARFGGIVAVNKVDLQAEAGRVTGLIGPNGAGKTTLFNMLCGLQRPDRGQISLDGVDITGRSPVTRARMGLARTFQRLELFDVLTCGENVLVAAEARVSVGVGPSERDAVAVLDRVGLGHAAATRADELPTGQARLLEVARALATRPKALLLDEPAAGLSKQETDALSALVRSLAADGLAVVLVEHDIGMVMRVCDEIVVLDAGVVIAVGDPETVQADPRVVAAYFGSPRGG